jgi:hypothetical protein
MNSSSRNTIDSKASASRKVTGTSNGGVDGRLHHPSLGIYSFPPIKLKRGNSVYDKIIYANETEEESFAIATRSVDDTPQSHPSHVPTPTTFESLCPDYVHEVIFDTIPTTFEKIFSYPSQEPTARCLGGSFWGESPVKSTSPVSAKPLHTQIGSDPNTVSAAAAASTALQRKWEVENTCNLHQGISSRRLLDKDLWSDKSPLVSTIVGQEIHG